MRMSIRLAGIFSAATLLTVAVGCGVDDGKDAAEVSTVFVGTILTVDAKNSVAEAVSVSPAGHIVRVGSERHVREGLPADVKTVKLAPGQVMAPGFIDPHMHLGPTIIQDLVGTHNIAPCLPPPFESRTAQQCARVADVTSALQSMTVAPTTAQDANEFILGMNLDPSRQQFVPGGCGTPGPATLST